MTNTELLMPDISSDDRYDEEWKVILNSRGQYTLSKNQAMVLKQGIATGNRGTIMFETFAIPIPYIVEFYRVRRFLKGSYQLSSRATEKEFKPISAEKFAEWKKKIYEKIKI